MGRIRKKTDAELSRMFQSLYHKKPTEGELKQYRTWYEGSMLGALVETIRLDKLKNANNVVRANTEQKELAGNHI